MEPEDILIELTELSSQSNIKKSELLDILKKYARTITVYDLMRTSERMRKEGEYLLKITRMNSWKFILRISYCA